MKNMRIYFSIVTPRLSMTCSKVPFNEPLIGAAVLADFARSFNWCFFRRASIIRINSTQESSELFTRNFVTFASCILETIAIENSNISAKIRHEPSLLQRCGGNCNARSPSSKHHCQIFMRKRNLFIIHAIKRHQQPTCASLKNRV